MSEVVTVKLSPNRSNIMYVVRRITDLQTDFSSTLKEKQIDTPRVIVYCRTLMICADLFSRFSYEKGKGQYYPLTELSENCLFGMFHASTPQHSKDVIMGSLQDCHGTVKVVFASVAMGMGIYLHGVSTIIHYGAPRSIGDYFQASGRRGRSGDSVYSIVYWTLKVCQTGDWIAKKSPPFMIRNNSEYRTGEVTVSTGTHLHSPTACTTRSSPVPKEAELICCCFL